MHPGAARRTFAERMTHVKSSEAQPGSRGRVESWPASAAAGLAFLSAATSLYWTVGGTFLLDTVGGAIEDVARERSAKALALGAVTTVMKVGAGLLALALVRRWRSRLGRRLLLIASWGASGVLMLWGAANVVVGALVLAGVVAPSGTVDERALRFHVFLWDPWFVIWGAALAVAAARFQSGGQRSSATTQPAYHHKGVNSKEVRTH
jgi:Protein of unknown function (DUF3995)